MPRQRRHRPPSPDSLSRPFSDFPYILAGLLRRSRSDLLFRLILFYTPEFGPWSLEQARHVGTPVALQAL